MTRRSRLLITTFIIVTGIGSCLAGRSVRPADPERRQCDRTRAACLRRGPGARGGRDLRGGRGEGYGTSAALRVGIALVAYVEGRYPDAASALRDALRIDPKDVSARILLGRLQRRTGDLQGAVHTYEALQADHPAKGDRSCSGTLAPRGRSAKPDAAGRRRALLRGIRRPHRTGARGSRARVARARLRSDR